MVLYGRQKGRPVSEKKAALLTTLLPRLQIPLPCADPRLLFPPAVTTIDLEIGFGFGERLARVSKERPLIGFIGCEAFRNGIIHLLSLIERDGLENIRIFPDDAHQLLEALPPESLDYCRILFPDPWPKKRHHKRRFITPASLDCLADLLKDRGQLHLATDDPSLARWMFEYTWRHPQFRWAARTRYDWRRGDGPPSRYEQKARSRGLNPFFFHFERLSRQG